MGYRATTALPAATQGAQAVVAYGYVFLIGGISGGVEVATVRSAPISNDGTVGTWGTTTSLPEGRSNHQAFLGYDEATQKTYIFVIGGEFTGTRKSTVWYAQVNGTGTLSSWSVAGAFPEVITKHRVSMASGWVFVMGGNNGATIATVRRATVAQVIAGTWTSVSSLPATRESGAACTDGLVIYYLGGNVISASVYSGSVAPGDGTITWTSLGNILPATSRNAAALAFEDNIYLFGGGINDVSYTSDVIAAPALSDGTLGDFYRLGSLPVAQSRFPLVNVGQSITILGGDTGSELATVIHDWVPTFSNLIDKNKPTSVGIVHKLHIYYNGSLQHRYCDKWFPGIGTEDHEPRIRTVTPVVYGIGTDHVPISADCEIVLDNSDEGVDWIMDRATAKNLKKATLRLYVGSYDTNDTNLRIHWKQLGEFIVKENATRDAATVRFGVSDNFYGHYSGEVQPPTIGEWANGDTGNPFYRGGSTYGFNVFQEVKDKTIPVMFGHEYTEAVFAGTYNKTSGGTTSSSDKYAVWVVGAFVSGSIAEFTLGDKDGIMYKNSDGTLSLPSQSPSGAVSTLWVQITGSAFTKNGKSWKVIYIVITLETSKTVINTKTGTSTTYKSFEALNPQGVTAITRRENKAAEVLRDLASYYLPTLNSAALDIDSLNRVNQMVSLTKVGGTFTGAKPLREILIQLCSSWDIDMFLTGSGKLGATGRFIDYENITNELDNIVEFEEDEIWDVTERFPSFGQRWAPVNRIFLEGLKPPLTDIFKFGGAGAGFRTAFLGPFDNPNSDIGIGLFEVATLSCAWRDSLTYFNTENPWNNRAIDSMMRATLNFKTHLGAARLKPGDFFRVSWTRNKGASDPYSSDVFKLDEINISTRDGFCEIKAAYFGDEIQPFILDDQTFLEKYNQATGGNCTVVDGSGSVTFAAGDLGAAGVVAGDHLVLKDSTEATDVFQRNRALKITAVTGATTLTVSDADLDFDAGAGIAVATWSIYRSHLTGSGVSLPNYPDGHTVYGKCSDSSSLYSDASDSHKLLDG